MQFDQLKRREFITLLGGAAAAGRSRRARSRRASCRPSGSWVASTPATMANGSPRLCSGCANSAGSRAAPSRSSIAGRRDATSASPRSRPSSSGSKSMSSSRREPRRPAAKRQHRPSRSCSLWRRTRSAAAWSRVSRGRAATSPACRSNRPILRASGSNFCARWCPIFAGWRSWPMSAIRRRAGDGRGQAAARTARSRGRQLGNPASGGYRARLRGAQGPRWTRFMSLPTRS